MSDYVTIMLKKTLMVSHHPQERLSNLSLGLKAHHILSASSHCLKQSHLGP